MERSSYTDHAGGAEGGITSRVFRIDPVHSKVFFRTRFLRVMTVRGVFSHLVGVIREASESAPESVDVEIEAASLRTANRLRDKHLLSGHYFDVRRHPTITFRGHRNGSGVDTVQVSGELTVCGISRTVDIAGLAVDRAGDGMSLHVRGALRLDRHHFDLAELCVFGVRMTFGGALIAREVDVDLDVLAVSEPAA